MYYTLPYIKNKEFLEDWAFWITSYNFKRISKSACRIAINWVINIIYGYTRIIKHNLETSIIQLNTNWHHTNTSKRHINDYLYKYNIQIQQYNWTWYIIKNSNYITWKKQLKELLESGAVLEYIDNMELII